MAREQVVAIVRGRVQGVFFRASTQREAARLGLVGWVRNLGDGAVEILAEGDRAPLEKLLEWAHHGPPDARVDAVEARWGAPQGDHAGFMVTSDA